MNFPQFFKKPYYRTPLDDTSCWFLRSNQIKKKSFIKWSHFVVFFLHFFIIDNCNQGSLLRKCLKMFCLCNNLLMHINENTDFLRQKPQQLPSAKANFKGCFCSCRFLLMFSTGFTSLYLSYFFFFYQSPSLPLCTVLMLFH